MDVAAATGDDVGAVTELWVALAREQRAHDSHLLAEENREQARDLVAQYVHTGDCAVARSGGQPVGFVMFHVETGFFETDATRGVVDNIYVLPDLRGEGVGSALLDYAEGQLRDAGADVLAVEALWDNEAARRLYDRRGYAPHRVTMEKPTDAGADDAERDDG
ncbi:GNAT family N-acetyltransferase [Halobacterium sp. KA-6]|jgi:ribosomal protein S18 acetylase RimI-like enzyme|uniref:GNAT family N-acetyltransferase n=1 Tax=Halobacterium sp. KA-6 TaxID=2896368 RepID=UPI001E650825|nr:GNAT family N-acetyltransferase [Halobacterium sp. KA-6]MCD2203520.1 GNAT family N-acetyltransferase [Halobacterium sp. KA-6]